jgi:hypothetical protein
LKEENMVPTIPVPVVLQGGFERHLWSENGKPNGVFTYEYCRCLCFSRDVHCGHDVEANFEPIFAATDGVVKFAGPDQFYAPIHVDIEPIVGPFRGEYHIYGHLSDFWVAEGQTVQKGQRIGTTGTAGTGPHLHWERRKRDNCSPCGAGNDFRSADPTEVLASPNANGGGVSPAPLVGAGFQRNDRIGVANGPLRLRDAPGIGFPIRDELPTGVQLCVTGKAQIADGFVWSPVRVLNTNKPGWIATEFCSLLESSGCQEVEADVPGRPPGANGTSSGKEFQPHPDTGMPADSYSDREMRGPQVHYDEAGDFVGVVFPAPPSGEADPLDHPWANG